MDHTEHQNLVAVIARFANATGTNPVAVAQIYEHLNQNNMVGALTGLVTTLGQKLIESRDEVSELTSKLQDTSEKQSRPNKYGQRRRPDWEKYCDFVDSLQTAN